MTAKMNRREFITLLGGAAAWPLEVRAQESGRTYRLGFLLPTARQTPQVEAFFDELRLNGFVEGKNLVVVRRCRCASSRSGLPARMLRGST